MAAPAQGAGEGTWKGVHIPPLLQSHVRCDKGTRLTARKKPFGVGCFPKIYVSFTYPIPLPYGGGNIGVNTPVARVGEAVSSI